MTFKKDVKDEPISVPIKIPKFLDAICLAHKIFFYDIFLNVTDLKELENFFKIFQTQKFC